MKKTNDYLLKNTAFLIEFTEKEERDGKTLSDNSYCIACLRIGQNIATLQKRYLTFHNDLINKEEALTRLSRDLTGLFGNHEKYTVELLKTPLKLYNFYDRHFRNKSLTKHLSLHNP